MLLSSLSFSGLFSIYNCVCNNFFCVCAMIFKPQKYLLFGALCAEHVALLVAVIPYSPVHPPLLPVGHALVVTESEAGKKPASATSFPKRGSKILVNPRLKNCLIDCLLPFLILQCLATQGPALDCLI